MHQRCCCNTGPQLIGDAMRTLHVAGPEARGLDRIVGAANQLIIDFFEGHHGHDRAEDFLLIHAHLVARAVEHGGLVAEAGLTAAGRPNLQSFRNKAYLISYM
jgi:hypothetical protein